MIVKAEIRIKVTIVKRESHLINQYNEHTVWVTEFLLKNENDIDFLAEYMPSPVCGGGGFILSPSDHFLERD